MSNAPAAPEDNSAEVARIEAQAAEKARQQAADDLQQKTELFNKRLDSAFTNSIDDANQFFTSRGLDAENFAAPIQIAARRARGSVPNLSENPSAFFDNLGQIVADQETGNARAGFQRDINNFAGEGFATRRIDNSVDDPFLAAILAEQRASAEGFLTNLQSRGLINDTGFAAGNKDLERQSFGAKARLNEVGLNELERGRSDARNIANDARRGASNFELGGNFDPFSFSSAIDTSFGDFFAGLSDNLRANAPTSLFDTAGLPNIAGAASGAQNTPFDPAALAGIFTNEEDNPTIDNNTLNAF